MYLQVDPIFETDAVRGAMMPRSLVITFIKQCALQRQQKVDDFKFGDLPCNWNIAGTEDVHTQSNQAKQNVHQPVLRFGSGET